MAAKTAKQNSASAGPKAKKAASKAKTATAKAKKAEAAEKGAAKAEKKTQKAEKKETQKTEEKKEEEEQKAEEKKPKSKKDEDFVPLAPVKEDSSLITTDILAKAIENCISGDGRLTAGQAYDLAEHVLNFFGYEDRIIDNVLEPEDRDPFYQLEDFHILYTGSEEITLYDGREWRIHYWFFNRDMIRHFIENPPEPQAKPDESKSVYDNLVTDDMWGSRGQN